MELAYAVADLVVSRAGAIAISELCVVGKPVILIPSPNVSEDHQTKNAKALEVRNAAVLIPDRDAVAILGKTITTLLGDEQRMASLGANISTLAIHDAANRIAREALQMQGGDKSMKDIPESVYFLGIGGIGMSALARYFASHGAKVSGYDRTETPLTDQLQHEGMHIHFTEDTGQIPASPGTVIYTPAVPDDHKELVYFREHGVTMKKRAEILGEIARKYKTVAVAGTHGKTTTSTLIAHILHTANTPFLAFLGGISKNYETNYVTNLSEHQPEEIICVVEADEYDKSFLQLSPDIAIITSIDADHLDIYGSYNDLLQTFSAFSKKIKSNGSLILKKGIALETVENNTFSVYGYVVNGDAAFSASNIRLAEGLLNFDFVYPDGTIPNMILNVPGMFNLENAIAALAVGIRLGIDHRMLRKALSTYEGVKRRFEYIIRKPELVYIDDYAHHPEELRAAITATRDLYPGRKITGIFQPHLFSRTRDLADDFALSLGLLDELILMEIYPAREKPIEGITSQLLLDKVNLTAKKIVQKETMLEAVSNCNPDVLLTLGAGDIDQFVEPIRNLLTNSEKS
jgi:UDP-N-acetylmuramate--alanine ligase